MDRIKKVWLIAFYSIIFCAASYAQPPMRPEGGGIGSKGGMQRGEVTDIRDGSIFVNVQGSGVQEIMVTSQLMIAREKRKSIQAISIGQNIMAIGRYGSDNRFQAFVIRIIGKEMHGVPQGIKEGPVQGKVSEINPLKVRTSERDIEIDTSRVKNVFEGFPIKVDELKAGDTVMLLGPPGRIVRVIVMEEPAPMQERSGEGISQIRDATGRYPKLPLPPIPEVSSFKREIMDAKKDSPFGFKDPIMLRVDLFSWYDDYADAMNDLGVYWMEPAATFVFSWAEVQKKNPDGTYAPYNWDRYDRLVKNAQAHNIHISAIISAAEPKSGIAGRIVPSLPTDMEGFRAFVYAAVERYDGDGKDAMPGLLYPIKRWKIEDEPFSSMFFQGTGSDYAVLLKNAYDSIKSADHEAVVICAMIYATHGPIGTSDSERFLTDFFSKLSEITKNRPYDIIDEHWIAIDSERSKESEYALIRNQIILVNKTASRYGFRPAPFESLEVAVTATDESTQAKNIIKHHAYGLALGLKKIFWSGIKAVSDSGLAKKGLPNDAFRANAIINGDDTRRLAYYSYKKMVDILKDAEWDRTELIQEQEGVYIVKFYAGKPVWIIWNDSGRSRKVTITLPNSQDKVRITKFVPSKNLGGDVLDYNTAFREESRQLQGGVLELSLNDDTPLFVNVLK